MAMNALAFERIWFEKFVYHTAEKNYYQQLAIATSNECVNEHKDEHVVIEQPRIKVTNSLAFEHIWFKKSEYDNAEKNYYLQLTVDQSNRIVKLQNNNARPSIKYNTNCIKYIRKYITRSEEIVMKPSDTEKTKTEEAATDKAETKEVESEKINSKKTETEEAAPDKADTEEIETEKIKSEKYKTEEAATDKADTKEVETEKIKIKKIKTKKIKTKKIKTDKIKTDVGCTAYKGKRRSYGEYCCVKCSRSWKSVNSWANQGQRCKTCNSVTYPHRQLAMEKVDWKMYDYKRLKHLCAESEKTKCTIHNAQTGQII